MNLPRFSVRNRVAVNLLMWLIIVAGIYYWFTLVREFFPNFESEQVFITVAWPGATPEEVEKSVTRRIEREIEDVDDVEEIESRILEGVTVIQVTLEEYADRQKVVNDLRSELDKVKPDLPEGAEDPEIREARPMIPVIGVVVFGDVPETSLRETARQVRDELLDLEDVSDVVVSGIRDREIWVEVEPARLEEHGLTFAEVGRAVTAANLDLPGGQLKGATGNVRVRTLGERDRAREIEDFVVQTRPDGGAIRLRDLARVRETFEDRVEHGRFDGRPAVLLTVFKNPEQDALEISNTVKQFVRDRPERLEGALRVEVTTDLARFIEQRLDLMKRNARLGLLLVLLALAFFLDLRVAFWVAMGLAIAFLGTFALMHVFGATINLISLFGLIVVLGLIVDDAIVIGENFYTKLGEGMHPAQAAVVGTNEVARPVLAAVLTTIVAFLPLMFIEGMMGTFLGVLPVVVMAALLVSLLEAFVILPAHLGHQRPGRWEHRLPRLFALARRVGEARRRVLEDRLPDFYERILRFVLRWRYPAMAGMLAFSLIVAGLLAGGVIEFVLLQETDAETVMVDLEMAAGTPEEGTLAMISRLERLVLACPETSSVFSNIGSSFGDRGKITPADPATVGQLVVELLPAEERERRGLRNSKQLVADLRRQTGEIPGVSRLAIAARGGGPHGSGVEIRVRGEDLAVVEKAVDHVKAHLDEYEGLSEIEDTLTEGKLEVRLRLRDSARALGLSTRELALQIRHALYGYEVQDLQGEEEEVTVRVLLPAAARRDLGSLSRLRIVTPGGGRVPLEEIATLTTARGYAALARVDGKRAITVTAEVDQDVTNTSRVTSDLMEDLADIGTLYPGVSLTFEGQQKEATESLGSLKIGFAVALLLIYSLIAILFRSYTQPVVVMAAIPYALVGAVLGHLFMGYPFTLLSMIGGVALTGIVVNDSLILVDFVNRERREGVPTIDAIVAGGRSRLRAILLTSITTIFGVGPLMLERSLQAQFLIPMAISIVFGLAFATVLTLVLLPTLYLAFEDVRAVLRWLVTGRFTRAMAKEHALEVLDAEEASS